MWYLIALLFAVPKSHADFPACPNNMVLAKDFIRAEIRGWRLPDVGRTCLKGQTFKNFKLAPMRTEEGAPNIKDAIVIRSADDVVINNIISEGDDVTVEITVKDRKGREHKDLFSFSRNAGELLETFGCLSPADSPKNIYLLSSCKKN